MIDRAYVLLHGLFVSIERGKRLEVYLPRMASHVYVAGNWLSEISITEGSALSLHDVATAGLDRFDEIKNHDALVRFPNVTLGVQGLNRQIHAVIDLPRPRRIHPLRILQAKNPGDPVVTVVIESGNRTEVTAATSV